MVTTTHPRTPRTHMFGPFAGDSCTLRWVRYRSLVAPKSIDCARTSINPMTAPQEAYLGIPAMVFPWLLPTGAALVGGAASAGAFSSATSFLIATSHRARTRQRTSSLVGRVGSVLGTAIVVEANRAMHSSWRKTSSLSGWREFCGPGHRACDANNGMHQFFARMPWVGTLMYQQLDSRGICPQHGQRWARSTAQCRRGLSMVLSC